MGAYSKEQFMAELKVAQFTPKGKFSYQNENFMLLSLLLEKLYGMDFAAVVQQQIFDPTGMKESGVNLGGKIVDRLTAGYVGRDGGLFYPPLNNLAQTFGGGCIYSTSSDLWRFLRAIARGQLLNAESLESISEPKAGPYSYGWFARKVDGQRLMAAPGKCRAIPASSHSTMPVFRWWF